MKDDKPLTSGSDPNARLQEKILQDYPRLGPDDKFQFACHPGVPCFNRCCSDVNIFLTPYDVLRLRKRLGMGSTEFLEKHVLLPVQKDMKTPVVVLRMNEDEAKTCPFLGAEGCSAAPNARKMQRRAGRISSVRRMRILPGLTSVSRRL